MHTQFYESILTEIQSGNVKDGVTLLVGMLDALAGDHRALSAASSALKAHELWALLLEDPICASANAVPREPDILVDLICNQPALTAASSTARRLFEVTSSLTFARAIRERAKLAEEKLVRAWQTGAKICILGADNLRALRTLAGQDLSNIIFVDSDPQTLARSTAIYGNSIIGVNASPEAFLSAAPSNHAPFDLICAATLADQHGPEALGDLLSKARNWLTQNGTLHTASFVPQHLGSGWRRVCLGWDIECHTEAHITQSAADAGLNARTYRDITDSVIWAEFRLGNETSSRGDLDNG